MVENINTRIKILIKLLPLGLLTIIAVMVFSSVYSSGEVHLFPHAFAVDNQQRLYLLFSGGGYCVTNDRMIGVLPPYDKVDAISVSEENQLAYLRGNEVTVYDIDQNDPASGKLTEVDRISLEDDADFANQFGKPREQNGIAYTYHRGLFTYSITQEEDGKSSLFYQMPNKDVIWNLIVNVYIVSMVVGALSIILHRIRTLIAEQNKVTD
jgi:hypothetical protein